MAYEVRQYFSSINNFSCIGFAVALIIYIWAAAHSSEDNYEIKYERDTKEGRKAKRKELLDKTKWILPVSFLLLIINCFLPSKNEALLIMVGGRTLDYVGKDSSLSKIPYQTTAVISQFLEKQLKEMKSEK